jgi:3-oxoacyl-[acyl-carrier protein] reductase
MKANKKLHNKRIAITGASMGIGKAVAIELAQQGASIIINSRGANQAESNLLEQLTQHINENGGNADYSYGDVSDFDYAGEFIQLCCDRFGGIDGLINLAGIAEPAQSNLLNISPQDWQQVIDVHLHGTFNTCRHAAPLMVDQGNGVIINTGSHAFLGSYGGTAYAAAKGAINSFSAAIAKDLQTNNVRCNVVLPGAKTRLSSGEAFKNNMLSLHARGLLSEKRLASALDAAPPSNIAPVYTYLLSDSAQPITGKVFTCSGKHLGSFSWPDETIYAYRETDQDGPWSEDKIFDLFNAQ